jgi:hypothetical protein
MMAQRAATLTFKFSDATTYAMSLPAGALVTPQQKLRDIQAAGGFWTVPPAGDTSQAGSVWYNYSQIVSMTVS